MVKKTDSPILRIAIMQPYFFPYLGYLSLIKHTDQFILFDTVQYIRHGWIERNRVLKQNNGWIYISVPLIKNSRGTLIKDTLIDNQKNWKQKIISQLQPYQKTAPYYYKVIKLLDVLFSNKFDDIVALNKASLEIVCDYLEMDNNISVYSNMNLAIEEPKAPDEWALNICKAIGNKSEYWNLPGGQSFFDKTKYDNAGLTLKFQKIHLTPYDQKKEVFEPGLSILDALMFNSIGEINEMLDNFELI
jgi:hypothetical protein